MGLISSSESGDDQPSVGGKARTGKASINSSGRLVSHRSRSELRKQPFEGHRNPAMMKTTYMPASLSKNLQTMSKINDELDQLSNNESIDSDRFRSIN